MKRIFLSLFVVLFFLNSFPEKARGQRKPAYYQTSAGLRLSPFYGASIKQFFNRPNAVEGIVHSSWGALKITGLYERHFSAFNEPGLMFYLGGGGHLGYGSDNQESGLVGVDVIVGIEYVIPEDEIPINISLDWKPLIEFAREGGFLGNEIGLTLRYIFKR